MRLIDADALKEDALLTSVFRASLGDVRDVEDLIDDAPTIDAVEVVRCRYCKRYRGTNYGFMVCGKFDVISCEDDFCVWGEREMDAEVNDDAELV